MQTSSKQIVPGIPESMITGKKIRIQNNGGTVRAPYQWMQDNEPPLVETENGADIFVETDCDSSGNCTGVAEADQQPHMMIYSSNCVTFGPWYNMVTNACRQ